MNYSPPVTHTEPITEILHGVTITDPYRWLEDQNSPRTRAWIDQQTRYARSYLDNIPGREKIEQRVREFLTVETCDSLKKAGGRYFFRKRLAQQEQPSLYMSEGPHGEHQLLVDPATLGRGVHLALKLRRVSVDGRLLLYEIKQGGERSGSFAIFDVDARKTLPDSLSRGYLRAFAFAPRGEGFYYAHEAVDHHENDRHAVNFHVFGTDAATDQEVFAKTGKQVRIAIVSNARQIGFLVYRFGAIPRTNFYIKPFDSDSSPEVVVSDATYRFSPAFIDGRIIAKTNCDAPNFRIVELRRRADGCYEWLELIPETKLRIKQWSVVGQRIVVTYRGERTEVAVFDLEGAQIGGFDSLHGETVRMSGTSGDGEEVFIEFESFIHPSEIYRYSLANGELRLWSKTKIPFDPQNYTHIRTCFRSKDGTSVPVLLAGRRDVLSRGSRPTIMTSYGGYGASTGPQFSVLATILMEQGCVFALPSIRGGSEFGTAWHDAAKRHNRQIAYDDFLSAAEALIENGRTTADRLAIFGGSNSGLLVGAAMTQRPELFRAVLCMVPILDMLRYHLFDDAYGWRDEFGASDDPEDFEALHRYSPYHRVQDGVAYPSTMIVSGDADQNCNALHARKMAARLQAAQAGEGPIILDYSPLRGHSSVLPLSQRIEALTDRVAFLCEQLGLRS